ncbi:TetR/AcrR family transcriptional regulator [Paraferrimonas haliotis]|uniref:TetR family transcriptional regulator n=1 Tax=Paraferrimonas haliotis TaxID=2013866 RepID=A0AA37WXV0_9GAMM|nr:TetR/AcrR family transcriptional regulator [Paraferrimonas haliotis]GLS83045.1 TetR family transcriptional regulator [Paraferrimonas haliotis]
MANSKKQQLLFAALELFVKQGISNTSTASIAQAAGVASGTLFHHFTNKQGLIDALYRWVKEGMSDGLVTSLNLLKQNSDALDHQTYQEALFRLWFESMNWAVTHPLHTRFFYRYYQNQQVTPSLQSNLENRMLQQLEEVLMLGAKNGWLLDMPMDLLRHHCYQMYLSTSQFFLEQPHLWQNPNYQQSAFKCFLQSIERA